MKQKQSKLIAYVVLIAMGTAMLYPLVWLFFATFKDNKELFGKIALLPEHISFSAYKEGWKGSGQFTYFTFYMNTLKLVVPTVIFTTFSTGIVAYGFARFKFPFKKVP